MTQEQKIKSAIKHLAEATALHEMTRLKLLQCVEQLAGLYQPTGPKGPRKVTKNLSIDSKVAHALELRNRHIVRKRMRAAG